MAQGAQTMNNNSTQLRVLVVQGNRKALAETVDVLRTRGHWASGVTSAENAQARFMDDAFDVLLTEVQLPGLSGYDMVASLPPGRHNMQVVFMDTHHPAMAADLDAHWLRKPFDMDDLESLLRRLASLRAHAQHLPAADALAVSNDHAFRLLAAL
jgi:DNA-binding NtrC family response regulator